MLKLQSIYRHYSFAIHIKRPLVRPWAYTDVMLANYIKAETTMISSFESTYVPIRTFPLSTASKESYFANTGLSTANSIFPDKIITRLHAITRERKGAILNYNKATCRLRVTLELKDVTNLIRRSGQPHIDIFTHMQKYLL